MRLELPTERGEDRLLRAALTRAAVPGGASARRPRRVCRPRFTALLTSAAIPPGLCTEGTLLEDRNNPR